MKHSNLRLNTGGIVLLTGLAVYSAGLWVRRLFTRRRNHGVNHVTPVAGCRIKGAHIYHYTSTGKQSDAPTGWYWGQLYTSGEVDSWDGSCYCTAEGAAQAARECEP